MENYGGLIFSECLPIGRSPANIFEKKSSFIKVDRRLMDFKVQLSDNIDNRQERIIKEALKEISSFLTDDITVNLAFTNSTTLDNKVKGVALPNRLGGLDEERLDYSSSGTSVSIEDFVRGADDDVISLDEFRQALARDSRTDIDRKFVASIDLDREIYGSGLPVDLDIKGIQLTSANAKAVGLDSGSSSTDAIISLNGRDNLSDSQFKALVMHEVGHALGFVSAVDFDP